MKKSKQFNQSDIASYIAALPQTLSVNGPLNVLDEPILTGNHHFSGCGTFSLGVPGTTLVDADVSVSDVTDKQRVILFFVSQVILITGFEFFAILVPVQTRIVLRFIYTKQSERKIYFFVAGQIED